MLSNCQIYDADVRNEYGESSIHNIPCIDCEDNEANEDNEDNEDNEYSYSYILIYYLLTCDPPVDVNGTDNYGCTPIWNAVHYNNPRLVKILIDFGGDRTIKSNSDVNPPNMTLLDFAKEKKSQDIVKLLTEYVPSEEEKLAFQLECKRQVDSQFKDQGHPRFKQVQIDLKYHSLSLSIDAVKTGDLNLLTESLPHVDVRMAVSLTLIAIERDQIHLMGCLLEKLVRERAFKVRQDTTIEPLLYIGFDPTPYSVYRPQSKPSTDISCIVNRSRVLCLFKILYHKFIFLSFEGILELVQVLMSESLY
jgi:ankyrin repeat protein